MLYLPQPSKLVLDNYSKNLTKKIRTELSKPNVSLALRQFLTDNKIGSILTDIPSKLQQHNDDLIIHLVPTFNLLEYNSFIEINKMKPAERDAGQVLIYDTYSPLTELYNVFDYDKFISSSKSTSYSLASVLDRNTCTYCNRLYTNTVIEKDPVTKRFNDPGRITRPQFDHWFPKSKFPVLALSFYNLIPSCSVCNSSIKGDTPFSLDTHTHPYLTEAGQSFSFSYNLNNVHQKNISIKVANGSKIEQTVNEFKINEIYNAHSEYELKDLLELRFKYSDNYLDTLLNKTFDSLEVGLEEAYRLVFGIEVHEQNFHKRPFSKFKSDILKELGVVIK